MATARALHYVFKIGDRKKSYDFFVGLLGMKVLRHEEFSEGCAAECNGPYNGKWSKTMIGYGAEDKHFVLELTYNYEIGGYALGNDYKAIHITSDDVHNKIANSGQASKDESGHLRIVDPDGHTFIISNGKANYPVTKVAANVKDLQKSIEYWSKHLKMSIVEQNEKSATLSYGEDQAQWQLFHTGQTVDRGSAYGRIAFAYPGNQLKALEEHIKDAGFPILKPFVTLETPGKADVQVVILADPDAHEICFVGAEGFAELSQVDPKADDLIQKAMKEDSSGDWFKDGKKKV